MIDDLWPTQKAKRLIALTQGNVALESQAVSAASAQEHLEATKNIGVSPNIVTAELGVMAIESEKRHSETGELVIDYGPLIDLHKKFSE